jgi:hypothetical protein
MSTLDPIEDVRNVARRLTFDGSGTEFSRNALRAVEGALAAHYGEKGFEQSGMLDEWLDPNTFHPPDEAPLEIARDIVRAVDDASGGDETRVFDCVEAAREVIDAEIARLERMASD